MSIYRDTYKLLASPFAKLSATICRGIIKRVQLDEAGKNQQVQLGLYRDELVSKVERLQEYGFTSYPPEGGEACAVFLRGSRDGGLVIATDDRRYRIEISPDEVCLYHKNGQYVLLKNDEDIEISCNELNIDVDTDTITATTEVSITQGAGSITINGGNVVIEGGTVDLGGTGGSAVARIGDGVQVTDPISGTLYGTITEGSAAVNAVD